MQSLRDLSRIQTDQNADSPGARVSPRAGGTRRQTIEGRTRRPLAPAQFRERLLSIMDRKHHWAWSVLTGPGISRSQLRIHFQHEFATYVRDFPVLLARIHGKDPPVVVRRMLAENIYEEDTGGLSFGKSHPELFLVMMNGLGLTNADFEQLRLLPAARAYRNWLDRVTSQRDWVRAAAAMAIFVEGSIHDRREIQQGSAPKTADEIETVVQNHFLVRCHGVSPACMDLTRAHQRVETGHRHDAYAMVIAGARDWRHQQAVISCVDRSLTLWLRYRDAVARACGLEQ
jgi:pyrroloquinoline quinone (PQQ) biosynthesis protein C